MNTSKKHNLTSQYKLTQPQSSNINYISQQPIQSSSRQCSPNKRYTFFSNNSKTFIPKEQSKKYGLTELSQKTSSKQNKNDSSFENELSMESYSRLGKRM